MGLYDNGYQQRKGQVIEHNAGLWEKEGGKRGYQEGEWYRWQHLAWRWQYHSRQQNPLEDVKDTGKTRKFFPCLNDLRESIHSLPFAWINITFETGNRIDSLLAGAKHVSAECTCTISLQTDNLMNLRFRKTSNWNPWH